MQVFLSSLLHLVHSIVVPSTHSLTSLTRRYSSILRPARVRIPAITCLCDWWKPSSQQVLACSYGFDNLGVPIYCCFLCIWGVVFLRYVSNSIQSVTLMWMRRSLSPNCAHGSGFGDAKVSTAPMSGTCSSMLLILASKISSHINSFDLAIEWHFIPI